MKYRIPGADIHITELGGGNQWYEATVTIGSVTRSSTGSTPTVAVGNAYGRVARDYLGLDTKWEKSEKCCCCSTIIIIASKEVSEDE